MSLSKAGLVSPIPVTLAQRDAIIDKQPGYIVFNSDSQEAEMWTGTEWIILGNRPGTLNYRGGIDMTTSAPTYQPPKNGDMYLNEKEGVVTAGWANITGQGVLPNDRVAFDGTNWALITSGGGIPNLQVVTDAGDTTTHAITTGGYITAGNVQATDGLFSGNVDVGSGNITLNANGSASLTRIGFKPLSDSDAFIQATNQTTGKIVANHFGNGDITLGSDLVAKSKIRLNGSDGSAKFAGTIESQAVYTTGGDSNWANYTLFKGTQEDRVLNSSVTAFSVKGDGSAEFAGTSKRLRRFAYTSKSAFKLNSNGLIHC